MKKLVKKMLKKLKRFINNIFYSIPFGLKGGNDEMFTQRSSINSDSSTINENIQDRKLGMNLLKGEVTQEVKNLRYSDYLVSDESTKYKYNGDGTATKIGSNFNLDKFKIIQSNRFWSKTVKEGLNLVLDGKETRDSYTLDIKYIDIPRFRLESFCKMFEFKVESGKNKLFLHFSAFYDKYDSKSKTFLNELKKSLNVKSQYEIDKNEMLSNIESVSFSTYKAEGDSDLVKYDLEGIRFYDIMSNEFEYVIVYSVDRFERESLLEKYYSEEQDLKYKNKEKKMDTISISSEHSVKYCSECGREVNKYDAAITEYDYGYPLCTDCLKKVIETEKKYSSNT